MTIDEYTLIADLFGKKRSETRPSESKTSTIIGVATSDSALGSVRVRLNSDLTGGEDGELVIPTEAHVQAGDVVSISLVGGTAKAPRVTGTVGGGDRTYDYAATAHEAATQAVADATQAKAAATRAASDAASAAQSASEAATSAENAESSANQAAGSATAAQASAGQAATAASNAQGSAGQAATAASNAQASAGQAASSASQAASSASQAASDASAAQASATAANTAANSALAQLGTVEDVIGTVNWITEHGNYAKTTDTAVDVSKVYYTRSGSGTSSDPYVYTEVAEPEDSELSTYYELTIDQALSQYVASHLALTDAGLYVLKDGNGYKILLSNTGMSVIDPQGNTVVTYGSSITFDTSRAFAIGDTTGSNYIAFVPNTGVVIGSAVSIGSNKTLSDLITADDINFVGMNLLGGTANPTMPTLSVSDAGNTFRSVAFYNTSASVVSVADYDGYSNKLVIDDTATGNRGVGWFTEPGEIVADEEYTFSCHVKSSVAVSVHMHTYWRNGSATASYAGWTSTVIKTVTAGEWEYCTLSFVPDSSAQLDWEFGVGICFTGNANGVVFEVAHAKLEKGNKATDWTPAPEDIQAEALDSEQQIYIQASSVSDVNTIALPSTWVEESGESTVTDSSGTVTGTIWTTKHPTYTRERPVTFVATQRRRLDGTIACTAPLPDDTTAVIDGGNLIIGSVEARHIASSTLSIANMATDVTDVFDKVGEHTNNLNTLSGQADEFANKAATFEAVETRVSSHDGQLRTIMNSLKFNEGELELKTQSGDDSTSVALTSEKMEFRVNGTEVAYVSNEKLYIRNAQVLDNMQMGGFAWIPRSNGNLSLKWLGGVSHMNLLRNTAAPTSTHLALTRSTIPTDGIVRLTPTTSAAYAKFKVDYLDYASYNDGQYTISLDARLADVTSSYTTNNLLVYLGYSISTRTDSTFSSSYDVYKSITVSTSLTSDWARFSATFTVPTDLTTGKTEALVAGSNLSVEIAVSGSKKPVEVRNVKLEIGTEATPWSKNPND